MKILRSYLSPGWSIGQNNAVVWLQLDDGSKHQVSMYEPAVADYNLMKVPPGLHAEARQVSIRLTTDAERICFSVTDDGRGASEAERAEAAARGSFGLKSMANRITSLGGEFTFQSAPGQGTHLSGWLPAPAG